MKDIGNIISNIRILAKDSNNQTIYSAGKEGNFNLFKNTYDYTYFQIVFLRYLNFYNSLNLDIALKEVDEIVLQNEIFEDSYFYYKQNKKDEKKVPQNKNDKNKEVVGGFNWLFKHKE